MVKAYKNNYRNYESLFILGFYNENILNSKKLGNIMELKGDLAKAIEFYEECFSINKKYLGCLKKLIELNLMSKKFEESIKFCMKHLNINDKSADVHALLALNLVNKVSFYFFLIKSIKS